MFKTAATMKVNEATIIAAVQEYIDRRVVAGNAMRVTSVKPGISGGYATNDFEIAVEEIPAAE